MDAEDSSSSSTVSADTQELQSSRGGRRGRARGRSRGRGTCSGRGRGGAGRGTGRPERLSQSDRERVTARLNERAAHMEVIYLLVLFCLKYVHL
ncbi:aly/REF export factor 2-like [Ruditapes philippinarum]|uniref:aly/REF export factor 2-like n=1 Tax=Ruditapes philippinarum TaxID=129788 RepID=UPI00295B0CDA|nr:aly/REF export factor 2-like [Ruditapes philippinarum]